MKNKLVKNSLKQIKVTFKRFLSILIMSLLGVGFYAGLVSTSPDMLENLDTYIDDSKMYDISIASTLGLTDEDIEALNNIEGVEEVYADKSIDSLVNIEDKEYVAKIMQYNENFNKPYLSEGSYPTTNEECVIDANFALRYGYEIGDTITLKDVEVATATETDEKDENSDEVAENNNATEESSGGTEEDDDEIISEIKVKNTSLKIVGLVNSSMYVTSDRGTTTLGTGSINFYIYVNSDLIQSDYYTTAYIRVSEAENETTNSDKYIEIVDNTKSKIEEIKEQREQARYTELVTKAQNKVDEAQEEFNTQKADGEAKIADAEKEISDAESKISSSEKQLQQQQANLDTQKAQAEEEFKQAEATIANLEANLPTDETQKAYVLAQIETQKQTLEETKTSTNASIQSAQKQINSAKATINSNKQKLEESKTELENSKKEFEEEIADAQAKLDEAQENVNKIEEAKWYILDRKDNSGYQNYIEATNSMENLAKVFPIVFFLIAILISLTSMTRMVEEERIEIGTLKALGYTNGKIMFKYILYALLASIIGGIIGMSIGFYLIPGVIWSIYKLLYTIPNFILPYRFTYGLVGIIISIICIGGATFVASYKELKNMPSVLMRPKAPKNGKRVFLERITIIWKHLNFSKKVTVRNLFRYKKRVLMTIIGITGCTALILTGFGIKDSISNIVDYQYGKIYTYDAMATVKNDANIESILTEFEADERIGNTTQVNMQSVDIQAKDITKSAKIMIPEDPEEVSKIVNLYSLDTKEQCDFPKEDNIIITDKLASLLNVSVGDEVKITFDNIECSFKIENIVENYIEHYVYMSKETYEKCFKKYETNIIWMQLTELTQEQQEELSTQIINMDGIAGISMLSSLIESVDNMLSSLNYIVIVLIVASALLAFTVLYNLSNVNISERKREIATLKVLGFYDNEVDSYITKESIILTIIGIILGLFAGYYLCNFIIATCEVENLRFIKQIFAQSYIYAAVITSVFSIIVNILVHFSLKKVDMIESLKSVE